MKNEYIDVQLGKPENEKVINGIYQYDKGLKLRISGLETGRVVQIQYSVPGMNNTVTSVAYMLEDKWVSEIPDGILTKGRDVNCYVYISDNVTGITVFHIRLAIIQREKPESYNSFSSFSLPTIDMFAGDTATWDVVLYSNVQIPFTQEQLRTFMFTITVCNMNDEIIFAKNGTLLDESNATVRFAFAYNDTIGLAGEYLYQIEMRAENYVKTQQGSMTIRRNYNVTEVQEDGG